MSLLLGDFGPGFTVWRHTHSLDCLYFIVAGEAHMGNQTLGTGDGFFVPANQPYTYTAGPEGVKVLEIRNGTSFDMQVLEKDMQRYVEKAEALLDAKGVVAG
jgi:mannose-6-phosphate isomerase-like protein (cupin superfamily)